MDVQGFGNTFMSGFGMSQTATSGFGSVSDGSSLRPSSALMNKSIKGEVSADQVQGSNPSMRTKGGDDDEFDNENERREQMEFEQSLRDTSMSFFKTAKSTFMSTNDLESKSLMNHS